MDWKLFFTVIGASTAVGAFLYTIIRNFKIDISKRFTEADRRFEALENRIFQLAMGKTLREAMEEEKKIKKNRK